MLLPIKDDVRHTSHFCPLTPESEPPNSRESKTLNGTIGEPTTNEILSRVSRFQSTPKSEH